MKHVISVVAMCYYTLHAYAQLSVGLRLATSPTVSPATNHLFVNRLDPVNESLFNVETVNYSEQVGLMARLDRGRFWFMSELMYGQSKTQYSMIHTHDVHTGQGPDMMHERRSFLELPISAGFSAGVVEVFSGFSLAKDLKNRNEMEGMEGYRATPSGLRYGWHGGIGVNLGHVLFDIRYRQEFGNYGENQFLNGQELLLRNAPGRVVVSAGFRI